MDFSVSRQIMSKYLQRFFVAVCSFYCCWGAGIMDAVSPKVNEADQWWKSFLPIWDRIVSSYLHSDVVATLDPNEQGKLQQRLEQLIICMEENFHSKFDCRFENSQEQEERQISIQKKEKSLKELIVEVQKLRSSVKPDIQETYDSHYNQSRDALAKIEGNITKQSVTESLPSLPTIDILQEQLKDVNKLTTELTSVDKTIQDGTIQAKNLLESTKQCIKQFTDPTSANGQILAILRPPKRTRNESSEPSDAPARKKIASRFRKK